jgi:hypothetical protein
MPKTSDAIRLADAVEAELARRAEGRGTGLKPLWDADDLRIRLRQYDRTPFLSLLQQFIENGPTDDAIAKMAEKYPEKWVTALVQMGRMSGFTEKTEATVNVNVSIGQMSDSQLEDEVRREIADLGILDAEFTEIKEHPTDV